MCPSPGATAVTGNHHEFWTHRGGNEARTLQGTPSSLEEDMSRLAGLPCTSHIPGKRRWVWTKFIFEKEPLLPNIEASLGVQGQDISNPKKQRGQGRDAGAAPIARGQQRVEAGIDDLDGVVTMCQPIAYSPLPLALRCDQVHPTNHLSYKRSITSCAHQDPNQHHRFSHSFGLHPKLFLKVIMREPRVRMQVVDVPELLVANPLPNSPKSSSTRHMLHNPSNLKCINSRYHSIYPDVCLDAPPPVDLLFMRMLCWSISHCVSL